MSRDPEAHRPPPGWARAPSAFRHRGLSAYPTGRSGPPVARRSPPTAREERLRHLASAAAAVGSLLVLAPIIDASLGPWPPAPNDPAWRAAVSSRLATALHLPALGALVLTLLATLRPGRTARIMAFAATSLGFVAATVATALAVSVDPAVLQVDILGPWTVAQATGAAMVFAAMLGCLLGRGHDGGSEGPPGGSPLPGIDFLE